MIKFQFHTVLPLMTLSQLCDTGVKIPKVYCQLYVGVIGGHMVCYLELELEMT